MDGWGRCGDNVLRNKRINTIEGEFSGISREENVGVRKVASALVYKC